jgi:hypothetical protein
MNAISAHLLLAPPPTVLVGLGAAGAGRRYFFGQSLIPLPAAVE